MKIERLILRPSGTLVAQSNGPLCWYSDAAALQHELAKARALIAFLEGHGDTLPMLARHAIAAYNAGSLE